MERKKTARVFYIAPEDVIEYHNSLIKEHGGLGGIYPDSYDKARSVILTVQYYSGLRYRSLAGKAAYLMYLIIKGHLFPDGNKRTGALSGMAFLEC